MKIFSLAFALACVSLPGLLFASADAEHMSRCLDRNNNNQAYCSLSIYGR